MRGFVRRFTTDGPAPAHYTNLTQQTVSSYRLRWDRVREYLEKRFPKDKYPDLEFKKEAQTIKNDEYVFLVPEALTSDDHVAIAQLCEKEANLLEREQSPEPAEDASNVEQSGSLVAGDSRRSDDSSDISEPSSLFSTGESVESKSSVASVKIVLQKASQQLADILASDEELGTLYLQVLTKVGKAKFSKYHNRFLKKLFISLGSEKRDSPQRWIVRIFCGHSERKEVTRLISEVFGSEDRERQRAMDNLIKGRADREDTLQRYLANKFASHGSDKEVEVTWQAEEEDDSDDANETDSEDEIEKELQIPEYDLDSMKNFVIDGGPFHRFRYTLHGLTQPPATLEEAIAYDDVTVLGIFLRTQFDMIAVGEYSWLRELIDVGYSHKEIAQLLLEDASDAPWIYFEPSDDRRTALKEDSHLPSCVHQRSFLIYPSRNSSVFSEITEPTYERDVEHAVQELCGLAGIAPKSRDQADWNGIAAFEDQHSKATISYALKDAVQNSHRAIASRIVRALEDLCTAVRMTQDGGLCCDSFTVITKDNAQSDHTSSEKESPSALSMSRIDLNLATRLLNKVGLFRKRSYAMLEDEVEPTWTVAAQILAPLSITMERSLSGDTIGQTLHLCSLATQFLCLGFLAYTQAHVGLLQPFFLDTPQKEVLLTGSGDLTTRESNIKASFLRLTCLEDMIQAPVLTFSIHHAPTDWKPQVETLRHDLRACPEDILDTWGPGKYIYHGDYENGPCAVDIKGGVLYSQDKESRVFHWDRSFAFENSSLESIDPSIKVLIGALVTVNHACTIDEKDCWKNSCSALELLDTFNTHWSLHERQAGFQGGQYFTGQLNNTWQKVSGKTLKQSQLAKKDDLLLAFLETTWGLQVSYCTGIARRVPLRELVADVMPIFADTLFYEPGVWNELVTHHAVIENFQRPGLRNWLNDLKPEFQKFIFEIVRRILEVFQHTGVDQAGRFLLIAWPKAGDVLRGFKLPCTKQSYWARMLADCKDTATFAYISSKCLVSEKVQCHGPPLAWQNVSTILETAVMLQRKIPAAIPWTLEHERSYFIEKMDSLILLKVHRPDVTGSAVLIASPSKIKRSIQRRLLFRELQKRDRRLRERYDLDEPAEQVLISAEI